MVKLMRCLPKCNVQETEKNPNSNDSLGVPKLLECSIPEILHCITLEIGPMPFEAVIMMLIEASTYRKLLRSE